MAALLIFDEPYSQALSPFLFFLLLPLYAKFFPLLFKLLCFFFLSFLSWFSLLRLKNLFTKH
ncbi:hypothetical protein M6B38_413425 [Iris pallida]|uniref:Uncharacterized protein n=1 Tax=Iris pallida TaxID=29817 RepID=A0AAX6FL54_IRIPA|nr:hypothetical protein M6B38_413425 [Iris pallida]